MLNAIAVLIMVTSGWQSYNASPEFHRLLKGRSYHTEWLALGNFRFGSILAVAKGWYSATSSRCYRQRRLDRQLYNWWILCSGRLVR